MTRLNNLNATVRDRVTEELRERILTGRLLPGERLDINELSAEFGTSRTPVREAILALSHDGLARMAPRSGATVIGLTPIDIEDNFELMAVLAGVAAMWASQRATDEERAKLRELANAVGSAARNGGNVAEANREFHRHINLIAGSARLVSMLNNTRKLVPQTFFDVIPEQIELSLKEHDELVNAIVDGESTRAREIAELHLQRAGELLAERYTSLMSRQIEESKLASDSETGGG